MGFTKEDNNKSSHIENGPDESLHAESGDAIQYASAALANQGEESTGDGSQCSSHLACTVPSGLILFLVNAFAGALCGRVSAPLLMLRAVIVVYSVNGEWLGSQDPQEPVWI